MERQLHILLISSWYPTAEHPFLGNFVKRHAELIASKHKVTVLNLQSDAAIQEISIAETVNGNLREVLVKYPSAGNPLGKWRHAKKAFKLGADTIKDVDLIHGNVILSKGLQFVWAKRHFRKPLIVNEHGSYYRQEVSAKWSWKEKMILRKVMKAADCLTAVSPFLKSEMQALFPAKEIHLLPNVVDQEVFTFKEKTDHEITQFIHVSTLDKRFKNVSGILLACQLLKAELGLAFQLKIISDEPYSGFEELAQTMQLGDCVFFSGPAQPSEIAAAFQSSDALVMFSNYETFSIVVAEAWATGTPVIATPVGITEQMDAGTGIQVERHDVQGLKEAMRQVVERKAAFDTEKIRNKAKEYFANEVLDAIEWLYKHL